MQREFSVWAEGRHFCGCGPNPPAGKRRVTIRTWQKPETALEKSLAPRVGRLQVYERVGVSLVEVLYEKVKRLKRGNMHFMAVKKSVHL